MDRCVLVRLAAGLAGPLYGGVQSCHQVDDLRGLLRLALDWLGWFLAFALCFDELFQGVSVRVAETRDVVDGHALGELHGLLDLVLVQLGFLRGQLRRVADLVRPPHGAEHDGVVADPQQAEPFAVVPGELRDGRDTVFGLAAFKGQAEFEAATFEGDVGFWSATFERPTVFDSATFKGDTRFALATFKAVARFESTTFQRPAVFTSATFKAGAVFDWATFEHVALFESATFQDDAGFQWSTFKEIALFESAAFQGPAVFTSATFQDGAGFKSATFQRDAWFGSSTFQNDAVFEAAAFERNAWLESATFERALRLGPLACAEQVRLSGAVFGGPVVRRPPGACRRGDPRHGAQPAGCHRVPASGRNGRHRRGRRDSVRDDRLAWRRAEPVACAVVSEPRTHETAPRLSRSRGRGRGRRQGAECSGASSNRP